MRQDLRRRGDVDLAAELQDGVPLFAADPQMPGERRGVLLHVASSPIGYGWARNCGPYPASYLDEEHSSMFG
ncbi:hypothetical protein GCM10020295_73360 [Streptomyces cinereospinus]